jgi:Domain of unknown function (DUF4436)
VAYFEPRGRAPPLGVHADLLVLVWVQLAVILGLSLFVITWVSRR